ncbi:MAG: GNAT family N-acetyltransferase [Pseudomonadota bacterium]
MPVDSELTVAPANPGDYDAMQSLMPRLAEFELPAHRKPRDLWRHDAELLERWKQGKAEQCLVYLAKHANGDLLGMAITTLRPELLSGEPSAHLEALVVAEQAQGKGIAGALIDASEKAAAEAGALSITLNVFGLNKRARAVYARAGFDEELIRCSKQLR